LIFQARNQFLKVEMNCRICGSSNLIPTINLGYQPWGNNFLKKSDLGKEPFYPLEVEFCPHCFNSQLNFTVPKEVMFSNHTYLSGMTNSLSTHFQKLANKVYETYFSAQKNLSVLDIGSNDGTQLNHYKDLGFKVLGVESSRNIAQLANKNGINTKCAFFNESFIDSINQKFDVINASGIFFHLEELHSVTRAVKKGLQNEGIFVVQFIYLKKMIENFAFDQIYHEHLLYYNLKPLEYLLDLHGLEIFDSEELPIHGGSCVAYISHKGVRSKTKRFLRMMDQEDREKMHLADTYLNFSKELIKIKEKNLKFLKSCKAENKSVFGMGAPVKGNTLLNFFGIDNNLLTKLVEINPLRKGLYSPGSHLEVVMESEIKQPPDVYYVLAWNFKDEILKNNVDLINKGVEFYFPVEVKN
tara:strand:+ start:15236 stop:16474 length:1239 start_codon:yes stop_codon:yes gene_type:complete